MFLNNTVLWKQNPLAVAFCYQSASSAGMKLFNSQSQKRTDQYRWARSTDGQPGPDVIIHYYRFIDGWTSVMCKWQHVTIVSILISQNLKEAPSKDHGTSGKTHAAEQLQPLDILKSSSQFLAEVAS